MSCNRWFDLCSSSRRHPPPACSSRRHPQRPYSSWRRPRCSQRRVDMDGYRDYFSQGASSLADSAAAAVDFSPFSQAPSYLQSSPNLDLNSQADNFPFLDAYSGYLQSDGGHSDDGTPLGRGSRSRPGEFLPPRPSGAASRGGRGSRGGGSNSLNIGSGSAAAVLL
jgi:hypothetical protein